MYFFSDKASWGCFLKKFRIPLKYCAAVIFLLSACWSLACVAFNYLIVPNIVVPYVKQYCANNTIAGLRISVKDIYFHPVRGFLLTDLTIAESRLPGQNILSVPLTDVDLDWPAVFTKKIVIKRLALSRAAITLARDRQGVWNIAAAWHPAATKNTRAGGASVVVRECAIDAGTLTYIDAYKPGDTLARAFEALHASMVLIDGGYRITVSARAATREKESFEASVAVGRAGEIAGTLTLLTPHLADYWDYYLDWICKPWVLTAEGVRAVAAVTYRDGVAQFDNSFTLTGSRARYGDLTIRSPQVLVRQALRFERGIFDREYARTQANVSDSSVLGGKNLIASAANARFLIKSGTVVFEDVQALWKNQPVFFRGIFTAGQTNELAGHGEIAGIKNQIGLQIIGNRGLADWKVFTAGKVLDLAIVIDDLKSLTMRVTPSGGLNLDDLARAGKLESLRISGIGDVSGELSGELDQPSSWQGALDLSLSDASVYGFRVPLIKAAAPVTGGVLSSRLSDTAAYEGIIAGAIKADSERWGFEFECRQVSLAALAVSRPAYRHLKGTIRAAGAFVGTWGGLTDIRGGGSVAATNCSLRQLPFLARTEEGLRGLVKKFVFPDFNEVSAKYDVAGRRIAFDGTARAPTMKAAVRGTCDFSGNLAATAGLSLFSASFADNARRVLLPYSIGIDLLGSSIQIDISGKIPDLTRKIRPKTIGWINDFLSLTKIGQSKKYSLEELWGVDSKNDHE